MNIAEGRKVAEYPEPGIVPIQILLPPFRNRISQRKGEVPVLHNLKESRY